MAYNNPLSAEKLTSIFRTSPKDPLRIINREGTTIEFKESYSHAGMAQYFKTMAAFANNVGGYIIFGVGDKPRRLLGLKDKHLNQFEDLKVEDLTNNLCEYFSPEIRWEHCTFEYKEMRFGVIYTHPLEHKPCICKKMYDSQDTKYTLKEGDIYYRYGGRSERIHYEELSAIIDASRRLEEQNWMRFLKRAAKIGIENASLLDLGSGELYGKSDSVVIDKDLLSKIVFIKEGEFVEKKGAPTLRLIGDVKIVESGRMIVKEASKKVVKAIEPGDIVRSFLTSKVLDDPMEYLRAICLASSGNFPCYFLIRQAGESIDDAIKMLEKNTSRGKAKKQLIERLNGKYIDETRVTDSGTQASQIKLKYVKQWSSEKVDVIEKELGYCLTALMSLDKECVITHETYIKETLIVLFDKYYEIATPIDAGNMRKAIARIDELLNLDELGGTKNG